MTKKITFFLLLLFFNLATIVAQSVDVVTGVSQPTGIVLNGNDLYIATSGGQLYKKDISDLSTTSATEILTGLDTPRGMLLNGNDLYISTNTTVSKVDITDPSLTVSTVVSGFDLAEELVLNGNDLYISEWNGKKIHKIDISDPNPSLTTIFTHSSEIYGLAIQGNDLYFSDENGSISKIDLLNLSSGHTIITSGHGSLRALSLRDNKLYAGLAVSGILQIDISNPTPVVSTFISGFIAPYGFAFDNHNIYYSAYVNDTVTKYSISSDITNPEIVECANVPASMPCNGVLADLTSEVVATDDSGIAPIITQNPTPGTILELGTQTVTFTATDSNGNFTECSIDIEITEIISPEIICPETVTVNYDPSICGAIVTYDLPTISGDCSSINEINYSELKVLNYLQDDYGHNLNAKLTELGVNATYYGGDGNLDTVLTSDSWDIAILQVYSSSLNDDEITAISNYLDNGGKLIMHYWNLNSSPVLQQILGVSNTVSYNTPTPIYIWSDANPVFNYPNQIVDFTVVGDNGGEDNGDILEPDASSTALAGHTTEAEANQAAIILSNNENSFYHGFAASDFEIENYENLIENEISFLYDNLQLTAGVSSGGVFPVGTTTTTYTLTDNLGNIHSCSFDVTVIDNQAPEINDLADLTAECEMLEAEIIIPVAIDVCEGEITATTESNLNFTEQGTYEIIWNFKDSLGNEVDVVQNVIIEDNETPIVVGEDIQTTFNFGEPELIINDLELPTELIVSNDKVYFNSWEGNSLYSFSVSDPAGTLEILHTETSNIYGLIEHNGILYFSLASGVIKKYTIATQEVETIKTNLGNLRGLAIYENELYCADPTEDRIFKLNPFVSDPDVINVVTGLVWPMGIEIKDGQLFIADNDNGNVHKVDITGSLPVTNPTVFLNIPTVASVYILGDEILMGNYNGEIYKSDISVGNAELILDLPVEGLLDFSSRDNTLFLTSESDDSIYKVSFESTFANGELEDIITSCYINSLENPVVSDNCSSNITITNDASYPITETTVVTWTFEDENGNISSQTQNIIIDENAALEAIELDDLTAECELLEGDIEAPTVLMNCTEEVTATTESNLNFTEQGVHEITWIFNDGNGNEVEVIQNVIIEDTTAPEVLGGISSTFNYGTPEMVLDGLNVPAEQVIVGDLAYFVSWGSSNLYSYSLSDPSGTLVELYDGTATYFGLVEHNGVLYLSSSQGVIYKYTIATQEIENVKTGLGTLRGLAFYENELYCADIEGDRVFKLNPFVLDPEVTNVVTGLSWPTGLDFKDNYLFIGDNGDGNIYKVDITQPQPISNPNIFTSISSPAAVCVQGDEVFFSSYDGAVYKSNVDSASSTLINSFSGGLISLSSDNNNTLYLSSEDENAIYKMSFESISNIGEIQDLTSQCEVTSIENPEVTDNCSSNVIITNDAIFPITETTVVTWTFEDESGNISSQTQNIIIDENTELEVIELDNLIAECELLEEDIVAPTTMDNCTGEITATTESNLNFTEQGTFEIVWIFNDGNDNEIEVIQNVIIDDITNPEVIELADLTSECEILEAEIVVPTTMDNCAGEITATTESNLNFTEQGTFEIVWVFNDGNDNEIEVIQNVIIDDIINPELIELADLTSECEILEEEIVVPTTMDNCAGEIIATTDSNLNFTEQGTHEIVWIFNDGNDNEIEVIQNVIIDDITNPEVIELADLTSECEILEEEIVVPTTMDNCAGEITATTESNLNFTEQGTYEIVWIFNDGNDNEIEVIQNVIIDDITNPELIELADLTSECEILEEEIVVPTTMDNCGGEITAITESNLNFTEQGTFEIVWVFNDGNDNEIEVIQNVIIDDITNPELIELADLTSECEILEGEIVIPTTSDNCAGEIIATTESNLNFTEQGTFEIVWIFNDGNDNEIEVIQNVIIDDITNPEVIEIADITAECEIFEAEIPIPTTMDNCAGEIAATTDSELNYTEQGTYEIIWNFDDGNGNSIDVIQVITIDDTTAPEMIELETLTAECELSVTDITFPTTTDNCVGEITATTTSSLEFNEQGTHEIVWIFNDGNDNEIEVIQNVIIEDLEAPIVENCPENEVIDLEDTCDFEIPDYTTFDYLLSDNCGGEVTITQSPEVGTLITESTEVIMTFTDTAGNQSECSFMVELVDTTAPTFTCPELQTILVEEGGSYTLEDFTVDIPTQNDCQDVTFTQSPEEGTELGIGEHVVTLELTDAYGNTHSCEFMVKVTTDLRVEDEFITENMIKIYPNPAKDIVTIESDIKVQKIYILDMSGKIILDRKGAEENTIDVSALARGTYLVRVQSKNNSVLKKVVLY
ncbi:HYR domain-containing protein [Aureivirga sp. CE67]|uniref:HYR domain-containing protein n=1 Tax=Aureivirga sp. CE67 TaxID=1788983 RepID=UPI0018C9B17D|nr:HYR domain-containing protein [Aureivirga sp. CE67]